MILNNIRTFLPMRSLSTLCINIIYKLIPSSLKGSIYLQNNYECIALKTWSGVLMFLLSNSTKAAFSL